MSKIVLIVLSCVTIAILYSAYLFIKKHGFFETIVFIFIGSSLMLLTNYALLVLRGPKDA